MNIILSSPLDFLAGIAGAGAIIWLIIAILYALFPLIVMFQLSRLNAKASDLEDVVKELETQNKLTRQLLKAYGHEPEV